MWNRILKHQHRVEQRSTALAEDLIRELEAVHERIVGKIATLAEELLRNGLQNAPLKRRKHFLEAQVRAVEEILAQVQFEALGAIREAGEDVLAASLRNARLALEAIPGVEIALPAMTAELAATWMEGTMVDGLTIGNWLDKLMAATRDRIISASRQALLEGKGIASAARLMRRMGIEGSIPGTQGLARTILMSASNFAHERTYAANADILSGVRHLATLDGRTCLRCGPLDGKEYAMDEERPTLPLHWRCRCIYAPVVKTWRELGIDADEFNGGQRPTAKHEGRTVHHRDGSTSTAFSVESAGRVPAGTTYSAWLRGQLKTDPAFVESVLGSVRFALFRRGKLELRAMSTTGRIHSIIKFQ